MGGGRLVTVIGACALAVACAGKSVQEAAPESGAGAGGLPTGQTSDGAPNGALTPELSATGLPLDSVLGQLDSASQAALCKAHGEWAFRLRDRICDAFVESAVVMSMPKTLQEARQLCEGNQGICGKPSEPSSFCGSFPSGCSVTVAELDRCLVDQERWLEAVPSCETMTFETAPGAPGMEFDSCAAYSATCTASG